jgi:hypothetical protein
MEKEIYTIIATRCKPGDRWQITPHEEIYPSLTDTLEAYCKAVGKVYDFKLSPSKGEISIIESKEYVEPPKEIKKFNIYGD